MKGYSDAIVLNDAPIDLKPIVSFIDDANYNCRLGAIFEIKAGAGKLLVSTLDIQDNLDERPAAKQMRQSILKYMTSSDFDPQVDMRPEQLDTLFSSSFNLDYVGLPVHVDKAVLNVIAGVGKTGSATWQPDADKIINKESGFDYTVNAKTVDVWWKQFWQDEHVVVEIECPKGFKGDFYVHYEDVDRQRRAANISLNGNQMGQLSRYDGNGIWLKFPVSVSGSEAESIVLDSYATGGENVCITQIILVPDLSNEVISSAVPGQ